MTQLGVGLETPLEDDPAASSGWVSGVPQNLRHMGKESEEQTKCTVLTPTSDSVMSKA